MKTVGIFAYGETGIFALKSLLKKFQVLWVVVPTVESFAQSGEEVIKLAKEKNLKLFQTNSNEKLFENISQHIPDSIVISSYNKILPEKILKLTKCINVHHGDLPRWRGRANINWAIITGRKEIGLTFHDAAVELDAGNVYKQIMVPITDNDTVKTVYGKFNLLIEKNLCDVVEKVLKGDTGKPQKGQATYCATRLPDDGYIDWGNSSKDIHNLIRGVTKPFSGAFTYYDFKKIIIWSSEIPRETRVYEGRVPGRIAQVYPKKGIEVLTGDGSILIKDVTFEGKELNASEIIKSTKNTLGITIPELFEKIQFLLIKK